MMKRSKLRRKIGCFCGVVVAALLVCGYAVILKCCPVDVHKTGNHTTAADTSQSTRNASSTLPTNSQAVFRKSFQDNVQMNSNLPIGLKMDATTGRLVTHVGFLKVHKAASTTIQNMLFRFALRHDLDIILPKAKNLLNANEGFIQGTKSGHFDILACHTIYNKSFFTSVLPVDSVNIGIVRKPHTRIISAAYYFRDVLNVDYLEKIPKRNFIHNLVRHPELYDKENMSLTKNSMANDFGLPSSLSVNDTRQIANHLQLLKREFLLVMVMERFDESLVLLRRLFNWTFLDIIYRRANTHDHTDEDLTPADITQLKKTNFLDYALYDFFVARFENQVKAAGQDFNEEVCSFNATLERVKSFCDQSNADALHIGQSKWTEPFTLLRADCELMKKPELAFIEDLRRRQLQRYWFNGDMLHARNCRVVLLVLVACIVWRVLVWMCRFR